MDWWIRSNNAVYLPRAQQLLVLVHLDVDAGRNVSFLFEVKLLPNGAQWKRPTGIRVEPNNY